LPTDHSPIPVLILPYPSVADRLNPDLPTGSVAPEKFRARLDALHDEGCTLLTAAGLVGAIGGDTERFAVVSTLYATAGPSSDPPRSGCRELPC